MQSCACDESNKNNIIQFPDKKLKFIHVFLDILRGAAEVSDSPAFHVVERYCRDVLLSEVWEFHVSSFNYNITSCCISWDWAVCLWLVRR